MSETSIKVFVTHSWRDLEFTRQFCKDLTARGIEVWFDDQTLQGGHRMAEEINRGLEWCDVYIPILSPAALDSPWCWEEINAAMGLSNEKARAGRPRIIPALAEDCQLPAILRGRLYINLAEDYKAGLAKVVAAIHAFRAEQEEKVRERVEREQREAERAAAMTSGASCASRKEVECIQLDNLLFLNAGKKKHPLGGEVTYGT